MAKRLKGDYLAQQFLVRIWMSSTMKETVFLLSKIFLLQSFAGKVFHNVLWFIQLITLCFILLNSRQSSGLKILTPQGLEVGQIKEIEDGESNMTFPLEMDVRIKVRDSKPVIDTAWITQALLYHSLAITHVLLWISDKAVLVSALFLITK